MINLESLNNIKNPDGDTSCPGNNNYEITKLSTELGIHPVTATILYQRNIRSESEAKSFLNPTLRNDLPNPTGLKNSLLGVERIISAIKNNEYITIFSDFDVDGITSASQLWLVLSNAGAKLRYYVPDRQKEGYGLSEYAVRKLAEEKTNLLVTLDCGITNIKEIKLGKDLGLDIIIVDHHEIGEETPPADIIINPHQEDCKFNKEKLATAGICWLLSIILIKKLEEEKLNGGKLPTSKELLDLAAIGTICDMVPLTGVNRLIASRGLDLIRTTPRLGIQSIIEIAGLPVGNRFSCSSISFGIGPRLNAAGRVESANLGFKLLTSDSSAEVKKLATTINKLNNERKDLEEYARESCLEIISREEQKDKFAYALFDDSFHLGVIGIAAQRIVEATNRPVAVMTLANKTTTPLIKGSVRSVKGFHVSETLNKLSNMLLSHGGHAEAGGFSLLPENLDKFKEGFNHAAKEIFKGEYPVKISKFDHELNFSDITIQLVQELQTLAPFGIGNASPLFKTKEVEINQVYIVGESHVKIELNKNSTTRTAMGWRMSGNKLLIRGNLVDIIYSLELNTYKGITSVQLIIKELIESKKH